MLQAELFTMSQAASILQGLVPCLNPDEDADEREYAYTDPETERHFFVRRSMGFIDGNPREVQRFFLYEMYPLSRELHFNDAGYCIGSIDRPDIQAIEDTVGPNGFLREVRKLGVDTEKLASFGAGYSVTSIYHLSLEACAEAIAAALHDNVWYNSNRVLTDDEVQRAARVAMKDTYDYWSSQKSRMEASMASEKGLFKGCFSMLDVLSDEAKKDILSYINQPSQEAWLNVRNYCIVGGETLWQAWTHFDASAPRMGSTGFPSADTLRAMMRAAVTRNQNRFEEKLKGLTPSGLRVL